MLQKEMLRQIKMKSFKQYIEEAKTDNKDKKETKKSEAKLQIAKGSVNKINLEPGLDIKVGIK
jgi:hypothetical protein